MASLRIFDVRGRIVRTLGNRQTLPRVGAVRWDHHADDGGPVPAGVYWVRLEAPMLASLRSRILVIR